MISLNYKKIAKLIQIQLGLDKEFRISAMDLLSVITNDIENIVNSEPVIPPDVISRFKKTYGNDPATKPPFVTERLTDVKIIRTQAETAETDNQTDFNDIVAENKNRRASVPAKKAFK